MSVVETFEYIIRHQSAEELVPFLLQLSKAEVVPVRNKTKDLRKELEQQRQLGIITWGRVGTNEQVGMLFLAAVATYSRKEALRLDDTLRIRLGSEASSTKQQKYFLQVATQVRPIWLSDWLQRQSGGSPWGLPNYSFLREMEARGVVEYEPAFFARTAAQSLHTFSYTKNETRSVKNYDAVILQSIEQNIAFMRRDLIACFDYATTIDSASAYTGVGYIGWQDVMVHLAASGHLSRADLLTRCLLALRGEVSRWFKNLYLALQPTTAEKLERQSELVELLAHASPLVVYFALDQLKALWTESGFEPAPLLRYADGLVTRQDLRTGLRTLLSGFEKLLKHEPTLAVELGRLSATALTNADTAVQERAAKVLASILGAKKPLLTEVEREELISTLVLYAELLNAAARTLLESWLAPALAANTVEAVDAYSPRQEFIPNLSSATAIVPVRDWHELLFLTGQVLQHDNPTTLERWLDGLLGLQAQFPADYATQLQPYLVQLLPSLKHTPTAKLVGVLPNYTNRHGHAGLSEALVLSWAYPVATSRVAKVPLGEFQVADPLVSVQQQRLIIVEERLRDGIRLPLLSTPTHAPYWVAPSVLVQKLLAYEAAGYEPDPADVVVALSRTAWANVVEVETARALLPGLQQRGLWEVVAWLLGSKQSLPAMETAKKSLTDKLAHHLSKLLPSLRAAPDTLEAALPWIWAVATRTKYPEGYFPELASVSDYAGVAEPWKPVWELEQKIDTYVEKWKPGKPTVTVRATHLRFAGNYTSQKPPSKLLLYSQHYRFAGMKSAHFVLPLDFAFLVALLPNYPAPLYWHVIRSAGWTDKLEASERGVISQALRTMLVAGPVFDEAATLLLAVGLTHHVPVCRALALEVLLQAITERRLVPALLGDTLGRLLGAGFVPVPRLTEQLAQGRAINATTDDVLHQTLDALLPELGAQPPRNTRKLLEAYADLTARTCREIPTPVEANLQKWASQAAMKKVASGLLASRKAFSSI